MGGALSKPVDPSITEKNIPDQTGRVFLVTGSTSGIGKELAHILYQANATVWIVGRAKAKVDDTIKDLRTAIPQGQGQLKSLVFDLNDLETVRPAAKEFLRQETRLDVLWNNAGIMIPPAGSKTSQGYESQLGVNVVAPFLLTQLLTPIMVKTARSSDSGSTRIVWVSSSAARKFAPEDGINMQTIRSGEGELSQWQYYGQSKAAAIYLAAECARRYGSEGIISVSADPGNLDTNLYVNMPRWQAFIARRLALKPAIFGAYTELFAALSPSITQQDNGAWIVPWGKIDAARADIEKVRQAALTAQSGISTQLWEWCEKEVSSYS